MLKLMDKHAIIKLKREGHSNRKTANILSIDRKTVAKYWNQYQKDIEKLKSVPHEDIMLMQEKALLEPTYDSSNRKKYVYSNEIDELLDDILESETLKDKKLGSHKQKLTIMQIHEIIINNGFKISKSTLAKHIKIKRDKVKECFIKQEYDYGKRLEYDFGEVKLIIAGIKKNYYLAVFSSPASGFRYAYLYDNQRQEAFLDSHIKFFEMIGGVYEELVYDNMRNVVSTFLGRNEKELNLQLVMLSNYYAFKINVTNCFRGNEKGHVESSVKEIRNKVFSIEYEFENLEAARKYLLEKLIKINLDSKIEEEKLSLKPNMPPYELSKSTEQKVNTYSFIQVDKNKYSVPDYLVGKTVTVKTTLDKVYTYLNNVKICEHKKIDGEDEISINIFHYLNTFQKKPGALKNSLALKKYPDLKAIYDIHFTTRPKEFIEYLTKNKDKNIEEIIEKLRKEISSPWKTNYKKQILIDKKTHNLLQLHSEYMKTGGIK